MRKIIDSLGRNITIIQCIMAGISFGISAVNWYEGTLISSIRLLLISIVFILMGIWVTLIENKR